MFGKQGGGFGGLGKSGVPDDVDTGPVARRDLRSALLYNGGVGFSNTMMRHEMLAPWKSTGISRAPQQEVGLPSWVHEGASLSYCSQSTGKFLEVFVDKILNGKKEVKIVFASDGSTWKRIPFALINSRSSPLRPLRLSGGSSTGHASEALGPANEPAAGPANAEPSSKGSGVQVVEDQDEEEEVRVVREASRSRSPRRPPREHAD